MRTRLAVLTAAGALVALPALAGTAAAGPAPAVTAALPGTAPLQLKGATVLGRAPATAVSRVTLSLALRDRAGLTALLAAQQRPSSPDYQRWLTPEQFAARFSPAPATVDAARSWARAAGLQVTEVSANRTLVTLSGTTTQYEHAFGVRLLRVRAAGQTFTTPDRAAALPAGLRSATAAVLGLSTYRGMHLPLHTATPAADAASPSGSYGPRDFWKVYDAPAATTGTGQTLAVITQGDLTQVKKDLVTFETRNALPKVPVTVVQTTATSTDTSGADEYDLDTQYSTGFAPGARSLRLYNSDTLGDVHPLNAFVTEKKAKTASASYGGCEILNAIEGDVAADDQVFAQAQAQGQSFWFSSGDEGSSCSVLVNTGTPVGVTDVEYPASSPYAVAVGGTTLTGLAAPAPAEISWIGGGGGYSNVEKAPSWQAANLEFQPALGRGVPDVSLDADPGSGYVVVVAGTDTVIGGTSASTPAWNGIWARVLQRHPSLGYAAPVLYRTTGWARDITVGTNGVYAATPGYDLTTGLGTADIARLVQLAH